MSKWNRQDWAAFAVLAPLWCALCVWIGLQMREGKRERERREEELRRIPIRVEIVRENPQ